MPRCHLLLRLSALLLAGFALGAGGCRRLDSPVTPGARRAGTLLPGRFVSLQSGDAELTLDRDAGYVPCSLRDLRTGREYLAATGNALVRLSFSRAGDSSAERLTLSAAEATARSCELRNDRDGPRLVIRLHQLAGQAVDISCTVSAREGRFGFRVEVQGREALVLEEVQLPVLTLALPLGSSVADDALFCGDATGGLYRLQDVRPGFRTWLKQPGLLAAPFAYVYDAEGGVYTDAHDAVGYPKRLAVRRLAAGLELAWTELCHAPLAAGFTSGYELAYGILVPRPGEAADWRDAADRHRAWAEAQPWFPAAPLAGRDDTPGWLKEGAVVLQLWQNADSAGEPDADLAGFETWFADHWAASFAPAHPIVAVYGWEHGRAWIAPKYFPLYPSEERFSRFVDWVRSRAGHVFLWPSGYQWTLTYWQEPDGRFRWDDRADFEVTGRPHAVVRRDGSIFRKNYEWLAKGEGAALCRGEAWSRDLVTDACRQLATRGVDLLQMDQVVAGLWPCNVEETCYSTTHGHRPGYGRWDAEAYNQHLTDLRLACAAVAPGIVLSQEQPQELFLRHFQLFDYRESDTLATRPEVEPASGFAYLYHDIVPLFANGGGVGTDPLRTGWGLIHGEVPIFFPTSLTLPGEPRLANGGFEAWRGTTALGWLGRDGRPDREIRHGGSVALRLGGAPGEHLQTKRLLRVDGTELTAGHTYRVRLWLRTGAVGPQPEQVNITAYDRPPDTDWRQWRALGNWTIRVPPDTDWSEQAVEFTVPAGAGTVDLMLRGQTAAPAWFDDVVIETRDDSGAWCELRTVESGALALLRQWVRLLCDPAARPFLFHGRLLRPPALAVATTQFQYSRPIADPQPMVMLQAYGDALAPHGAWNLSLPAGDTPWQRFEARFAVPPEATQLHVFLPLEVQGTYWFDDVRFEQPGGSRPGNLLANGGFEAWPEGQALPSDWMFWCRDGDHVASDFVARETEGTQEGRAALRLAFASPAPGVQVKAVVPVREVGLEPGVACTFSLWVRTSGAVRADTRRFVRTMPAILHNRFRAPDGREGLVLANVTGVAQASELTWRGSARRLSLQPWEARLEVLP